MAARDAAGTSPLDRLRKHYERTRMRCESCGYVDHDGGWAATTTGRTVRYVHRCPGCGERATL